MNTKERISVAEFKAWLNGFLEGKGSDLPSWEDWERITSMMMKISEPGEPITPEPGTLPYIPWTQPEAPSTPFEVPGWPYIGPSTADPLPRDYPSVSSVKMGSSIPIPGSDPVPYN